MRALGDRQIWRNAYPRGGILATRLAQRLMKHARSGDAQAQVNLARLYLSGGEGLAANHQAALHWLSLAAQAGFAEADALIAECVALDRAGSELHQFTEACERAAARGRSEGHCALGDIYASRSDTPADLGKAKTAYRAAARAGHVAAARKLGLVLAQDAPPELADPNEEAARWLRSAAAAGDQAAARGLGKLLWRNGDGKAVRWLEPEARRGDAGAMYRLGEILCKEPEHEPAQLGAYWLERAARKGHPLALWRYGRLHVKSFGHAATGLPHSPLRAVRLLKRAAAAGASQALWDLARIYELPRFSRRNLGRARKYLEQAASAGIGEAELELGKRLSRHKNDRGAWLAAGHWLSRASEQGSSEASAALGRIADRAPDWSPAAVGRQEEFLYTIRARHPRIATRLELAARFGLSPREMLFINPLELDRGWGIEVDLSAHFKRTPWRLVIIESEDQRLALKSADEALFAADSSSPDLTALSTTGRARQLGAVCRPLRVDPALFVRGWKA